MSGEAALVVAARGGQISVLRQLLAVSHSPPSLSQQGTAMYAASKSGQLEAVKILTDYGVNVDSGIPEPALIAALSGGHMDVALFLIHSGADCDIKDSRGNTCLHLACSMGLYEVVRCLCTLGCVQVPNLNGQYPLHIAARKGYIQIVRLLCFYGCKLDQKNGDGIRADITAVKYGHNDIAELIDKLRGCGITTSVLRSQFLPGNRPLVRLQVKLFGHSGVGKSSLAASLKAGLLHALFRRSTSLTTRSRPSSPCQTSQIEMNFTQRHNSLSFDSCIASNYVPTKGVQVHQMDLSGIGDITVWDFSGQEIYFQIFHYFMCDTAIPNPSCTYNNLEKKTYKGLNSNEIARYTASNDNVITNIGKMQNNLELNYLSYKSHDNSEINFNKNKYTQMFVYVIMFNLEKPYTIQKQQCIFWLNFIISRLSPCGIKGGLGNVILIGTHADLRGHKTPQGEYIYPAGESLLQNIRENYSAYFHIHHQVLALDCNASTSIGLRAFKSYLASIKQSIIQIAPEYWSNFMDGVLAWIINVRKSMEIFPVMKKDVFMANIRNHVNLLASDEHIIDVIYHLHIIGEILVFGNLIILCCDWMGQILGTLFGKDGLQDARIIGVYTAHDFQAHFGYCDATQLLELLQELRLCTMCEIDDEIEYEFPCFNLVEKLDGLWDPNDSQYAYPQSCYGGIKLCQLSGLSHLSSSVFAHIQVELRDQIESSNFIDMGGSWNNECDLYQWWRGSKLCWGLIESLITLNGSHGNEFIDLRIRSPPGMGELCFIIFEKIIQLMHNTLTRVAPGLILERYILSVQQLRTYCDDPFSWSSLDINKALMKHYEENNNTEFSSISVSNTNTGKDESLLSLICFDCHKVAGGIEWFPKITLGKINSHLLARLSVLLDPPHPLGTHWCMLAVSLGVSQDKIELFDSETDVWHTSKLLKTVNCNIATVIQKLNNLGRVDASNIIFILMPIYYNIEYDKLSKSGDIRNIIFKNDESDKLKGFKIHTDV